jgi:hypothetical protein
MIRSESVPFNGPFLFPSKFTVLDVADDIALDQTPFGDYLRKLGQTLNEAAK